MKQKKIFPVEWLKIHPYNQANAIDTYYTNIANEIYNSLLFLGITDSLLSDEEAREISCCLAAYFEDVVSQTNIWRSFVTENRKLYGTPLPFYKTGDNYFDDEINYEDICFLMWHYLQQRQAKSFINPENEGITLIADDVYSLFEDEYETAPENERMRALFSAENNYSDYTSFQELLQWFHYNSFLNIFNGEDVSQEMTEVINQEKHLDKLSVIRYAIMEEYMYTKRNALLASFSLEWLCRIVGERNPLYSVFSAAKRRKESNYLFRREDELAIYVTDIRTDEEFRIVKKSFGKQNKLISDKSVISTPIIHYRNEWWITGVMITIKLSDLNKDAYIDKDAEANENALQTYNAFMKGSNGEQFVYLSSEEELKHFFTRKMGYTIADGLTFPKNINNLVILTATKKSGLLIINQGVECIKDPRNSSYNQAMASREAISFFLVDGFCPIDTIYYLEENNMLPDAQAKSMKGEKRGKAIIHENYDFLIRYFQRDYIVKNN